MTEGGEGTQWSVRYMESRQGELLCGASSPRNGLSSACPLVRHDGTHVARGPAEGTIDTMYPGRLIPLEKCLPIHSSVLGPDRTLERMLRSSFHGYRIFVLWARSVTLPSCPQPSLCAQSTAILAEAYQG